MIWVKRHLHDRTPLQVFQRGKVIVSMYRHVFLGHYVRLIRDFMDSILMGYNAQLHIAHLVHDFLEFDEFAGHISKRQPYRTHP